MNNNNINAILNFIASCNEFVNGKFLFASAKLQSMFDEITVSPELNKLFMECNQDFNYSLEMTKAFVKAPTKMGYFTKPEELDKFLALIFGVFKEIKEETIDFNIFVNKYFSSEDKTPPTQKFAQTVIIPVRDTVAKYFELDQNNKTRFELTDFDNTDNQEENEETVVEKKEEEEPKIDLAPIFEQIKNISSDMLAIIKQEKKLKDYIKRDAIFLLSEIVNACSQDDIEKTYGLIIGFKYLAKNIRSIKYQMNEMQSVLIKLENI